MKKDSGKTRASITPLSRTAGHVLYAEQPRSVRLSRRIHAAGLISYGNSTYGALIQAVEPEREKKVSTLHKTIQKGGRYLVAG